MQVLKATYIPINILLAWWPSVHCISGKKKQPQPGSNHRPSTSHARHYANWTQGHTLSRLLWRYLKVGPSLLVEFSKLPADTKSFGMCLSRVRTACSYHNAQELNRALVWNKLTVSVYYLYAIVGGCTDLVRRLCSLPSSNAPIQANLLRKRQSKWTTNNYNWTAAVDKILLYIVCMFLLNREDNPHFPEGTAPSSA